MTEDRGTTFALTIATGNAAFQPDPAHEVARILRRAADRVEAGALEAPIVDANGARVGSWEITEPDGLDGASWADLLDRLPILTQGQAADLKLDTWGGLRVWLARTGIEDGEPHARTVYVEEYDDHEGRWSDVGYYDGDEPDPAPWPQPAAEALGETVAAAGGRYAGVL